MEYLTDVVDGLHMRSPLPPLVSESAHPRVVSTENFDAERMSGRIHAKEAESEPDMYTGRMDGGLAGQFECLDWSFSGADQ